MPAETPSPSPLTPEERADLEGISALWSGLPDGGLGYITSESSRALGRLLSEVDRLAARVSDLEAARLRDAEVSAGSIGALAVTIKHLRDEALDVAECRRLANVAVDQAEAARANLRSVMAERDGLRALCERVRPELLAVANDVRPMSPDLAARLDAAIEALGPGGGK